MKMRKMSSGAGVVAFALTVGLFGVSTIQAQGYGHAPLPSINKNQQSGGNGGQGPTVDPAEAAAIKAFNSATDIDGKIRAGEDFEQKYPTSKYTEGLQSILVTLYYNKQDWTKFYAEADKVTKKDPDNLPVLTLVGWVIPRIYRADDPTGPAKLDQSEKYEKHALDLMAAMQKPAQLSDDQFSQAKASGASEAHSGLGMTYFLRNDFENSAKEFQTAMTKSTDIDPADFYTLGVDLQKLNRNSDAAQAFTKCSQMAGDLQDRCKQAAAAAQGGAAPPISGAAPGGR